MAGNRVADDSGWRAKVERHHIAVERFTKAAGQLAEDDWHVPVDVGKWTPAQITEHLILTYQVTLSQMRGGIGIKPHYNFLLRPILRFVFLRRILRSGQFPAGANAPVEIQPPNSDIGRDAALALLADLSKEFELEIYDRKSDSNITISHHVFGELKLAQALELATVHTISHMNQLPARRI